MTTITPAQSRAARAWLEWSQTDLANHAGVSVPTIARFERGSTAMSRSNQSAIVRAFDKVGISILDNGIMQREAVSRAA